MNRIVLAGAIALALVGSAFAQSATITIAPEHRTKIKTYVTEKKVKAVTLKEKVTVGAVLPADVELVATPSDWGPDVVKYRYVYSGSQIYLVEPSSRKVVQVID